MTLSGRLPAPGEYERLPAGPTARTGEKRVGQDDCQDGRSERPDHSLHDLVMLLAPGNRLASFAGRPSSLC